MNGAATRATGASRWSNACSWICAATRARLSEIAEVDLQRGLDGQTLHRLLGVGGEWLMSLRALPDADA